MNTLCWSLTKNSSDGIDFGNYVYDMYYLSMVMAKSLGYRVVLYGNSSSIKVLREVCDEVINIDFLDYRFYDDPKVYIWATRQGDYATIDGDIFIYNRLEFDEKNILGKEIDLMVEKFQPLAGKPNEAVPTAWRVFNSQNPVNCIFEWDSYNNVDSYNTGLIYWKNQKFKEYYVKCYYELRKWYIQRLDFFHQNDKTLQTNISVSSHFICEHLMRRLANYYSLKVLSLQYTQPKSYTHLVGTDKFTNPDHYVGIKLLVDEIKYIKRLGYTSDKLNIEKIYIELSKFHNAI
jgi:hypothetical protein